MYLLTLCVLLLYTCVPAHGLGSLSMGLETLMMSHIPLSGIGIKTASAHRHQTSDVPMVQYAETSITRTVEVEETVMRTVPVIEATIAPTAAVETFLRRKARKSRG
jgi:hypothetical protein